MPKEKEDLWPEDLGRIDSVTPVTILREQASMLGRRTSYILRGEVETQTRGGTICHTFYVVAAALENYRYEVLTARHEVIFYPVDIDCPDAGMYGRTVKDEEELKQALKAIFTSDKLKKVIGALLAQAQS